MTKREWVAPGIVIALLSGAASVVGSLAVNEYRTNENEESIDEVKALIKESAKSLNERVDAMDRRLDEMSKGATDTARLEEQNRALAQQLAELKSDFREQNGKNDARYDNLSTRLARQGF